MLKRLKNLPDAYYEFWLWLANLKHKTRLAPLNFQNNWTHVLWTQRKFLTIALCCEVIIQTFYALYPLFIGSIVESQEFSHFLYLIGTWFCIIIIEYISVYNSALLEIQCINSVQYNAFRFFLTVDPIYHTMKTSGKLFAKIERCARSYEDFLDIILWDILPVVVSVIAVVIAFCNTHMELGLVALVLLLIIAFINITLNLFTSATFERRLIDADDAVKAMSVESLTQVQLIRSSFASNEIDALARERNKEMMYKEGTAWLAFATSISISRLAYLLSVFILGYLILTYIKNGSVTILGGTTLLVTYLNATFEIIMIGRRIRKLLKAVTRIKDLYSFIQNFGKQTFAVLSPLKEQPVEAERTTISIEAHDLYFDYNPKARIFDQHNLSLSVPTSQPNKLYGIIGPSGMGKTTLLSLLGGQLKPSKGTVVINGVSIYDADDNIRRTLLAVQGQIASSLSGSVRRNLLLGLPLEATIYTDEQIINVLKEVGIWKIFEEKEGLATPIGESGLTLSGGQRQRLNFAALYLRAQYFKPAVILIDEPTSSLDEVSERAITTMISQLAKHSLTLVIAHRLRTLNDAIGILDFSLLEDEKTITFYNREELAQKSTYYRMLMQGDITIDA